MAGRFEGKQALVLGVANRRSIAWGIAHRLAEEGAQIAFTYQGERIEKNVRDLAETVSSPLVTERDVRSTRTSRVSSAKSARPSAAGSTSSSTPLRSRQRKTSKGASRTPRAIASGWRSTSARTRSSRARAPRSR